MTISRGGGVVALSEFPIVYLSYDEPWSDEGVAALRELRPDAKQVHGVKGLNACHVAAADAAGSEWFLTVDADTRVLPSALEVTVDERLLHPHFRLDWQSRNPANGLISGNGSLKLWNAELVRRMRSHEAAPEEKVSLDADIGDIEPGKTRLVQMEGCHSVSDPAMTPYHGFRAGFRETVFLAWLLADIRAREGAESRAAETLRHILRLWCTLGRQHPNGLWVLYGARLGLWATCAWPAWDPRKTTDYDWFDDLWTRLVRPRIRAGARNCRWTGHKWNADDLEAEVSTLGKRLADRMPEIETADLDADQSALFVEARTLPSIRTARNMDSLGTAFRRGRIVEEDTEYARSFFDVGALLMYPPAINNMARLHKLDTIPGANREAARQLYELAIAKGDPHAPFHLAGMLIEERGGRDAEIEALFDLAAERGFAPAQDRR